MYSGHRYIATFCVDPEITPVDCPPHRIPIALQSHLKDELNSMENNNIICKVAGPTGWVNALVIVADRLRKFEGVPWSQAPQQGYTNASLPPTYFSWHRDKTRRSEILQRPARSSYRAIKLNPESSMLTTFKTMFAR